LDLRAGEILGIAKKSSSTSDYRVKFPTGTATIRKGEYYLAVSGMAEARIDSINITTPNADASVTTREIPAGHRFDPATSRVSQAPSRPVSRARYYISEPKLLSLPSGPLLRPGI
jgi:hypothetical protein